LSETIVRGPRPEDLAPLVEVYNHYIRETVITFDLEPITVEDRRDWFESFGTTGPHRLFVAEHEGRFAGYAYSGTFRPRRAYDKTVEATIYLAPDAKGKGIGRALYGALFDALAKEDVHRVIAGITLPNEASVGIHTAFGFTCVGVMTECGFKFGKYHDVGWYEKAM
jgi:phosphinothricin acetyltransferase